MIFNGENLATENKIYKKEIKICHVVSTVRPFFNLFSLLEMEKDLAA